jgi:hypothetical protein
MVSLHVRACVSRHPGLTKQGWKFALHRVSTVYRDTLAGGDAAPGSSVSVGITELASAFAALDTLAGPGTADDELITPDDVVKCIERQRTLVLSLISNSLMESQQALLQQHATSQ